MIISGADDDLMSLNIDTANWTKITKEDGVNGIYKYNASVKATGDLTPVFNKVTFANYSEKPASIPSISLYAYGIQSEGMSGNDTTSALALTALNAKAGTNFTLA